MKLFHGDLMSLKFVLSFYSSGILVGGGKRFHTLALMLY